jgi:hypothetical protein
MPCKDDSTCDVTGDGVNACSTSVFGGGGTYYPTPVCVGTECDPGDGTSVVHCDGSAGLCLPSGGGGGPTGICIGACELDPFSGAPPKGCAGKDACYFYGLETDPSGVVHAAGYCFGGCTSDADCSGGDRCQIESGYCVRRPVTYAKKLGEACTSADSMSTPPGCECLYTGSGTGGSKGYCSQFCEMGGAPCPTGFTCDAFLPRTDASGAPLFKAAPKGIAGYCMKDCATDADCAAINGYCQENGGTGRSTCQPGARP